MNYLRIPIILVLLLFLNSCSKGCKSEQEPSDPTSNVLTAREVFNKGQRDTEYYIQEIISLVMMPEEKFGSSRESIKAALGPWDSLETKATPNKYYSDQTDNIYTIDYGGLIFYIYDTGYKEFLLGIEMTQNHRGILPELIGQSRETIERHFGPTKHAEKTAMEYSAMDEIYPDNTIIFRFEGDFVSSVEWVYYFD